MYRTVKASFNKKKANKMFRVKVDEFQDQETFGRRGNSEISFSDLIDWGLNQEIMKIKTSSSDDRARANHLKNYFEDCKALRITPLDVDNFRITMKNTVSKNTGKNFSGTTVNKTISLARRIYYLAIDAGIVSSNPFARRGVFKEEPKGKYMPDNEFWAIHNNLPEYLKPVFLVAYLTGMRRGEIIELKWNQVNLEKGYIDLTSSDTKTEEPRRIFFNTIPGLKDVFIKAIKNRRSNQSYVFTKEDGSAVPKWYIERLLKKTCKKVNVGPYRLHDLRHTFNTNMLKAGVPKVIIMKLTGHKTLKMFSRYTHLDQEQGEDAMDKLNMFLGKKKETSYGDLFTLRNLSTPYLLPECKK